MVSEASRTVEDMASAPSASPTPPSAGPHIVWDWNGTLLHDIDVVLEATNASFTEIGIPPISLERYRELFCVPVPRFYERLLGRAPSAAEWELMDGAFHRHYFDRVERAGLAEGAPELLASWSADGGTHSLCSLAPHERLGPWIGRLGIDRHFVRVDGRRSSGPVDGKAGQMVRHLADLERVEPGSAVVIGDATDDALAAAHAGARAVLYTGGSHSRRSLESAGVPVVDTLAEAVRVAGDLVG